MAHAIAQKPALDADDMYYTDMPVGDILRRTREHYRQSLPDVERNLRIKATQLDALEHGDIDRLPGRVYAIGFVRSYAEYLGLDGDKMVQLFKSQYGRKTTDPELDFPAAASESKLPPLWLLAACIGALIVMSVAWWAYKASVHEDVSRVPDVAEALSFEDAQLAGEAYGPYLPKGYDANANVKPAVEPEPEGVTLVITQNSWVEVKDRAGKTLVSQVLNAGDEYFVPNRPDLTMSLGNAAGVSVEIGDEKLDNLGAGGQVLRNIPLDIEYLRKTYTTPSQTEN